jgi:hypothetical protein
MSSASWCARLPDPRRLRARGLARPRAVQPVHPWLARRRDLRASRGDHHGRHQPPADQRPARHDEVAAESACSGRHGNGARRAGRRPGSSARAIPRITPSATTAGCATSSPRTGIRALWGDTVSSSAPARWRSATPRPASGRACRSRASPAAAAIASSSTIRTASTAPRARPSARHGPDLPGIGADPPQRSGEVGDRRHHAAAARAGRQRHDPVARPRLRAPDAADGIRAGAPLRTSIGFEDPRSYEGELLFPERFPRASRFRESGRKVRRAISSTASTDGRGCKIIIPQDPGQAGKDQAASIIGENAGYKIDGRARDRRQGYARRALRRAMRGWERLSAPGTLE